MAAAGAGASRAQAVINAKQRLHDKGFGGSSSSFGMSVRQLQSIGDEEEGGQIGYVKQRQRQTGLNTIQRAHSVRIMQTTLSSRSDQESQSKSVHSPDSASPSSSGDRPRGLRRMLTRVFTSADRRPSRRGSDANSGVSTMCMPPDEEVVMEADMENFLGDAFKLRRVVLTHDALYFGKPREAGKPPCITLLDKVELCNIESIQGQLVDRNRLHRRASVSNLDPETVDLFKALGTSSKNMLQASKTDEMEGGNLIVLATTDTSDHSSRRYMLRPDTPAAREQWLSQLRASVGRELKRFNRLNRFANCQNMSRAVFTHVCVRWFFALAIFTSFVIDACETQVLPLGRFEAGTEEMTDTGHLFFILELAFTVLFSCELIWNIFSYWFWPFFSDGWSLFDFVVVFVSVISVGTDGGPNVKSIRMVRVLRALRVVSQFKSLRKIVRAITLALWPMMSAMFVCLIVISVFAILGVNAYAERVPDLFGTFGRAMWTLTTAATMENWVAYSHQIMDSKQDTMGEGEDSRRGLYELGDQAWLRKGAESSASKEALREQRVLDPTVIAFFVFYIVAVGYILTSVVVAVLLDNFAEASRAEEEADMLSAADEGNSSLSAFGIVGSKTVKKFMQSGSPLDPLLAEIMQIDNADQLRAQIDTLFEVLDADGSGCLSFDEVQLGFQSLDLRPRIQVSQEDFRQMTQDGTLLNEEGLLPKDRFEQMMMLETRNFIGRKLYLQASLPQNTRGFSSLFSGLNWLLMTALSPPDFIRKEPPTSDSSSNTRSYPCGQNPQNKDLRESKELKDGVWTGGVKMLWLRSDKTEGAGIEMNGVARGGGGVGTIERGRVGSGRDKYGMVEGGSDEGHKLDGVLPESDRAEDLVDQVLFRVQEAIDEKLAAARDSHVQLMHAFEARLDARLEFYFGSRAGGTDDYGRGVCDNLGVRDKVGGLIFDVRNKTPDAKPPVTNGTATSLGMTGSTGQKEEDSPHTHTHTNARTGVEDALSTVSLREHTKEPLDVSYKYASAADTSYKDARQEEAQGRDAKGRVGLHVQPHGPVQSNRQGVGAGEREGTDGGMEGRRKRHVVADWWTQSEIEESTQPERSSMLVALESYAHSLWKKDAQIQKSMTDSSPARVRKGGDGSVGGDGDGGGAGGAVAPLELGGSTHGDAHRDRRESRVAHPGQGEGVVQARRVTGGGRSVAAASTQYIDEKQMRMSHVAPAATLAKYHAAMMQRGTGRTVPEAHARMHMEHMLPGSLEGVPGGRGGRDVRNSTSPQVCFVTEARTEGGRMNEDKQCWEKTSGGDGGEDGGRGNVVGGGHKEVRNSALQDGGAGSNPKASDPLARAERHAGQLRRGPYDVDRDVKRDAAYGMRHTGATLQQDADASGGDEQDPGCAQS